MGMQQRLLATVGIITVSILLGIRNNLVLVAVAESFDHPKQQHDLCEELIIPSGYPCSHYTIQTKDGFLLGLQRVSSSSLGLGYDGERGPPVLLLHGLFMAGDHAWFINTPDQSLGFILVDHGFDVWVGNVRGTRWSHWPFWDWSWQDLAMYDLVEMINYINSVTNAKVFVLGHSQGKMSFAAFTQPEIAKKVEQLNHKRFDISGFLLYFFFHLFFCIMFFNVFLAFLFFRIEKLTISSLSLQTPPP